MTHDSLCIESFDSLILYTHQTEQNYITCIVSVPIRKMSIFLPFQDLTHQCIMASSSHKRRIWSQVTYFLYSDFQVGRTERLDNTLNPRFSKAVLVDYFFEELQKLKFFIYDIDSPTGNLKMADFLGELECTLGQVRYMLNLLAYYTCRHSFGSSGIPSVWQTPWNVGVRSYKMSDFSQTRTHLKKR